MHAYMIACMVSYAIHTILIRLTSGNPQFRSDDDPQNLKNVTLPGYHIPGISGSMSRCRAITMAQLSDNGWGKYVKVSCQET